MIGCMHARRAALGWCMGFLDTGPNKAFFSVSFFLIFSFFFFAKGRKEKRWMMHGWTRYPLCRIRTYWNGVLNNGLGGGGM